MMRTWALQDAKAKLSELVRQVQQDGPQCITVRGEPAVVVISQKIYEDLISPKNTLVKLLRASPLSELDLDLERDKSIDREIDL